jgi:hypothetical protein
MKIARISCMEDGASVFEAFESTDSGTICGHRTRKTDGNLRQSIFVRLDE